MLCKWLVVPKAFLQVGDEWRVFFTIDLIIEWKNAGKVRGINIYSCHSYSDSRGEDLCMWRGY